MTSKNPLLADKIILSGVSGSGIFGADGTSIVDENYNIDAPVTTTNLTTSGNTTLGNASADTLTVPSTSQFNAPVTVGVDDTGYDVKLFGATASKYWLWDESADSVVLVGDSNQTGNSQLTGTLTVGVDDTGHDVIFYGATASSNLTWDESADALILNASSLQAGGTVIRNGITTSSGAGAVGITGSVHEVTTTGTGDALTLADGVAGQRLSVVYVAEGAGGDTAVITPTTLAGGTTITLNALGDSCDLVFSATGGWYVLGLGGSAAVA